METTQPDNTPTALQQWNAVVQALLARGYSQLNAYETANKRYPGLWLEAVAESARQASPGARRATGNARRG